MVRAMLLAVLAALVLPVSALAETGHADAPRFRFVSLPATVRMNRPLRLEVRDTSGKGGAVVRVCLRPAPVCRRVALPAGRTTGSTTVRALGPGTRLVTLRAPAERLVRRVRVRHGRLRILAAGDSMIEIIDNFMQSRLGGRAGVRFDDHISTGISKSFMFDWPRHARSTAAGYRPDVTVMFIGANDGFPIGRAQCCGRAWVGAYAARVRGMMRAYARRGHGRVYWLLLPTPRPSQFRRVFPKVNAAIIRAEQSLPRGTVHLVDLRKVFTPGGRFEPQYRQSDGVHLNTRGASIAASVILGALRRDGVI